MFKTKSSGVQSKYSSGMVRGTTEGKARFDLLHPEGIPYKHQILTRWADLMARGGKVYGDRNWEKASTQEELNRFKESANRHFEQWLSEELDEDHAVGTMFNIMAYEATKYKMSIPIKGDK
jgi:hypothetical protein